MELKKDLSNEDISLFDAIVQKTKELNNELRSLFISKDLVIIGEEFIVKLQELERNFIEIYNSVVDSLSVENQSRGLYIHGPSGWGKSYNIYYLAALLRINNDETRVTYINSCEEWYDNHMNSKYLYLLKELICTFSNDEVSPLTLADWAMFVIKGFTESLDEKLNKLTTDQSKWVEMFKLSEN
ncbi:27916_t:CDS:2 [Dentiscutata erythropus]|uniref:27916_t:CDS:1 n=1 Tax=Dentiscutata erythropus TaxID=1348616 RepID=A0A9N9FD19_9GLOM|nr:27916_t:CDS:2 [Dentiscutata erythropus]